MQIKSIGIDLGKTTFHLVALGTRSQVVIRKKFSRSQLLEYTANLPPSLIGMEAGVGSLFLGRALREQGHEVRLIPAQFVRPFVKSNKNDYRDAEAIAEAVERENMRFVPIKTEDQLDLQALHRVRDRCFDGLIRPEPRPGLDAGLSMPNLGSRGLSPTGKSCSLFRPFFVHRPAGIFRRSWTICELQAVRSNLETARSPSAAAAPLLRNARTVEARFALAAGRSAAANHSAITATPTM